MSIFFFLLALKGYRGLILSIGFLGKFYLKNITDQFRSVKCIANVIHFLDFYVKKEVNLSHILRENFTFLAFYFFFFTAEFSYIFIY